MKNKNEKNNNEVNNETEQKKKVPISEKIEDALDDVVQGGYELFYGESKGFTEDIPAMIEKPSGIKVVNKVQTRRNINKKIFTKKSVKIILIVFGLGLGIAVLYAIFNAILMA